MIANTALEVKTAAGTLRGERGGEGPLVILAHGLSATRRYVLHGSNALARAGYDVACYDARGHGDSDPPADGEYGYEALAADLGGVADNLGDTTRPMLLAGHSMGAHTIVRFAIDNPGRVSAIALAGPAYPGVPAAPEELAGWDALADGLESGGVEGFLEIYARRPWPEQWRETVMRITRERLAQHRHPQAVAAALRAVPRSEPFEGLSDLAGLECPALIVASHDEADPGHPYAVAEAWADAAPDARLISEEPGASPLAWQGGRLARAIASFFGEVLA